MKTILQKSKNAKSVQNTRSKNFFQKAFALFFVLTLVFIYSSSKAQNNLEYYVNNTSCCDWTINFYDAGNNVIHSYSVSGLSTYSSGCVNVGATNVATIEFWNYVNDCQVYYIPSTTNPRFTPTGTQTGVTNYCGGLCKVGCTIPAAATEYIDVSNATITCSTPAQSFTITITP
jgi:hypothetical protein